MATRRDRKLLEDARNCAGRLGLAAKWAISGKTVSVRDDFVYETYVFLRLLLDCKKTYRVQYVEGSGNTRHAFPKSPAKKAGRPKFHIVDRKTGKVLWQLCAGTKIGDISGDERAPDISLQRAGATDNPTAPDVELIWDAKYKRRSGRIESHEFSEFARWIQLFQLESKALPKLVLSSLTGMAGHCLVTNGECSTENDKERTRTNIREVFGFRPKNSHTVRP